MKPFPFSQRFYIGAAYNYPTDTILTIYHGGYNFGHTWQVAEDWGADTAGKWTFNRGSVAIAHDYHPPIRYHATLEDLLAHLEATFPPSPGESQILQDGS